MLPALLQLAIDDENTEEFWKLSFLNDNYLQLPNSTRQFWESMGYLEKSMGHLALTVNLEQIFFYLSVRCCAMILSNH